MAKKSWRPASYANVPGMRTKALPWLLLLLSTAFGCTNTVTSAGVTGTGLTLQIQLSPPSTSVAGGNVAVTVEALTADQNIATNFVGTVHITSSDPQADLPADYTFTLADGGLKAFDASALMKTAGVQTITVQGANGETSGSAQVTIKAAAATQLRAAGFPTDAAAGQQGNLVVTAYDAYNNVADSYTGQVHVTCDSPNAWLPGAYVYNANDRGHHAFGITLRATGTWALTAQDSNTSSLNANQQNIAVAAGPPASLAVTGLPTTTPAGTAQSANVIVYDAFQNVASNFSGTIHFNTNDTLATVPTDYTFEANAGGVANFPGGFTFLTANSAENLTVSVANANVMTTSQIAVTPLQVTALALVPSPNVIAGTIFASTVKATDIYGNVVPWTGTVHFDGTDSSGSYPTDYLFTTGDHGQHQFTGVLTLLTAGAQNVIVTDNANILTPGTAHLTVAPAALHALTFGALRWVTANANFTTQLFATDIYGNAVVNFSGTINVYSANGNFIPQSYTMEQNVDGALSLSGVHFEAAGYPILNANNTVNHVVTNANFTVSAPVSFDNAQAANIVVGHPNLSVATPVCAGYSSDELWAPNGGIYVDSTGAIWLPDTANHRVVAYNSLPTINGQTPDFGLGELTLDTPSANWPGPEPANPNSMTPGSVSSNGGAGLVVVDTVNNRVLIYNSEPTSIANADTLVGQVDFTSSAAHCSPTNFNQPSDALVVGSRLFVSDTDNHRVLIWGSVPNSTLGVAASWALGQPDLSSCLAGTDANRLDHPHGLWSNGVLLAVADSDNNRVLLWNDVSNLAADGVQADIVLGQASMTTATAGTSATTMHSPYGVFGNGTSLFVADSGNNRVLVYPGIPTQSGAAASAALGQTSLNTNTAPTDNGQCWAGGNSTASTLVSPYGIGLSGTTLIVGSSGESRYLLYQSN